MDDTIQDAVQQQQQPTEENTMLCIGFKPLVIINEKMGAIKHELKASTHQLEERSEFCISNKIGVKLPVREENAIIKPEMTSAENDAELCIGYNSEMVPGISVVKILKPSTVKT